MSDCGPPQWRWLALSWLGVLGPGIAPAQGLPSRASNTPVREATGCLRVHPRNPRYVTDDRGRAIWLGGSHTWANRQERGIEGITPDFDNEAYLDFLERSGHSFVRLWAWEHACWMQFVSHETPVRYSPLPWARTGPGRALDGGPRFDLTRWDPSYFERLRDRVAAAERRGIWVAVMLFQGFSVMDSWRDFRVGSPLRPVPDFAAIRRAVGDACRLAHEVDLALLTPSRELASSGYCLAAPGVAYLVWLPDGKEVALDLLKFGGAFRARWVRPESARGVTPWTVDGGAVRRLRPPGREGAILELTREEGGEREARRTSR